MTTTKQRSWDSNLDWDEVWGAIQSEQGFDDKKVLQVQMDDGRTRSILYERQPWNDDLVIRMYDVTDFPTVVELRKYELLHLPATRLWSDLLRALRLHGLSPCHATRERYNSDAMRPILAHIERYFEQLYPRKNWQEWIVHQVSRALQVPLSCIEFRPNSTEWNDLAWSCMVKPPACADVPFSIEVRYEKPRQFRVTATWEWGNAKMSTSDQSIRDALRRVSDSVLRRAAYAEETGRTDMPGLLAGRDYLVGLCLAADSTPPQPINIVTRS